MIKQQQNHHFKTDSSRSHCGLKLFLLTVFFFWWIFLKHIDITSMGHVNFVYVEVSKIRCIYVRIYTETIL